jgi:hypothetical protein
MQLYWRPQEQIWSKKITNLASFVLLGWYLWTSFWDFISEGVGRGSQWSAFTKLVQKIGKWCMCHFDFSPRLDSSPRTQDRESVVRPTAKLDRDFCTNFKNWPLWLIFGSECSILNLNFQSQSLLLISLCQGACAIKLFTAVNGLLS